MKTFITLYIFLATCVTAAYGADLTLYSKVDNNTIHLKWITDSYSQEDSFNLYRSENRGDKELIAMLKPLSYKELVARGYSDDYIFMVRPMHQAETTQKYLQVRAISRTTHAFRVLNMIQNNAFAKNLGCYYADEEIKPGTHYHYTVDQIQNNRVVDTAQISIDPSLKNIDKGIFWIQADETTSSVKLSWDIAKGSGFYHVYRKLPEDKTFIKITKEPKYISPRYAKKAKVLYEDRTLKPAQKASYYVCQVDMFGAEGRPSATIHAMLKARDMRPGQVSGIFIKNSDKKMTLRWKNVNDTLSYNIYRGRTYNGTFQKINKEPIKQPRYFDKDFHSGRNYYYYVTALNMHGESKPSARTLASSRDVTPPAYPRYLNADVNPGEVTLRWEKSGKSPDIRYRIYISMDDNSTEWSLISKDAIKETTYTHKRAKTLSRHTYYYRVSAIDKSFNESAPSNVIAVRLPDVTFPKTVEFKRSNALAHGIQLLWNANSQYDFSHYNLYKKNADTFTKLNTTPLTTTSFTDTKPNNGINRYALTVVDQSGNESKKSEILHVSSLDNTPVTIERFIAKHTDTSINLSFTCRNKDYSGFELLRSSGNDTNYYNISGFQKTKSFEDTKVTKNRSYFYKLKVYDKVGNIIESNVIEIRF